VDWDGPLLDPPGVPIERIRSDQVTTALARSRRHAVLLLGDRALAVLDPGRVARDFCRQRWIVIACPVAFRVAVLGWRIPGAVDLVDRDGLRPALALAVRAAPRAPPSRLAILGRGIRRGSPAALACRVLGTLPVLTVGAWACALGWNRSRLHRVLGEEVGASPSVVIWRFRSAIARRERRRRTTLETIARMADYANGNALLNAYRVRGIPFPPEG
jgi:AraC-like DNA-binding protein